MAELERISIRKAVSDDLPQMLRIMDEGLKTPTIDDEMAERMADWLKKLDNTQQLFYVAESDRGHLVGWIRGGRTVEKHRMVEQEKYDCEVLNIFIHPEYQYRGIGRELWKILWNDILLSFHPENFVVWAVDTEQAHKFYSAMGGAPRESRRFYEDRLLTAFVWHDLKVYESTNFFNFQIKIQFDKPPMCVWCLSN